MEGFKNTREGTNIAAQATAITLAMVRNYLNHDQQNVKSTKIFFLNIEKPKIGDQYCTSDSERFRTWQNGKFC